MESFMDLGIDINFKERLISEGDYDLGIWEVGLYMDGREVWLEFYDELDDGFLEIPEVRDVLEFLFSSIGVDKMSLVGFRYHGLYLGDEGERDYHEDSRNLRDLRYVLGGKLEEYGRLIYSSDWD